MYIYTTDYRYDQTIVYEPNHREIAKSLFKNNNLNQSSEIYRNNIIGTTTPNECNTMQRPHYTKYENVPQKILDFSMLMIVTMMMMMIIMIYISLPDMSFLMKYEYNR